MFYSPAMTTQNSNFLRTLNGTQFYSPESTARTMHSVTVPEISPQILSTADFRLFRIYEGLQYTPTEQQIDQNQIEKKDHVENISMYAWFIDITNKLTTNFTFSRSSKC